MDTTKLDWDQFRLVLFISRADTFTKAARLLGVNQTTIGRRLNQLEEQLGVALFHRSRTEVSPTENGMLIVAQAESMESAVHNAMDSVTRIKTQPHGIIRIQLMSWLFNRVVAPELSCFNRRYPSIEIQAISDQRLRRMDKGETQISLRFDMPPRGSALHVPVVDVPYAIYASQTANAENLNWLAFREDEFAVTVESWMHAQGHSRKVCFWANDTEMLHNAAKFGLGKALLPMIIGENDPQLTCISGINPILERTLYVQYLPETLRLKRVEVFLAYLTRALREIFPEKSTTT